MRGQDWIADSIYGSLPVHAPREAEPWSTVGEGMGMIRKSNDLPFGDSVDDCIPVVEKLLAADGPLLPIPANACLSGWWMVAKSLLGGD